MIHKKILWAVEFSSPLIKPHLLGELWATDRQSAYDGEPTRTLLFQTRERARNWCKQERIKYLYRTEARWKFKPVRVVETVRLAD